MLKFYNREQELSDLARISRQSSSMGKMTVLTGRRRVGKTLLALEHCQSLGKSKPWLYFFVAKKSEPLLCEEFIDEIKNKVSIPVLGKIHSFREVFALVLEAAKQTELTLVIDEFQEFFNIQPSVYSDMQKLWDLNKKDSKLHVIFIGSVYSLMHKIFQDAKEPLFGRADQIIHVKPFSPKVLQKVLLDHKVYKLPLLFDYFAITGALPKYIDILVNEKAFSFDRIVNSVVRKNSPFVHEGRNLLIEEFGRSYNTYFSILELIASGKTSRPAIESILEKNTGGYLERLEQDYGLIKRIKPLGASARGKLQKYAITDNFLNFWFRFIHKNRSAIEIGNYEYIKQLIRRDYRTWCGRLLEDCFRLLLASSGKYNEIGSWWDKGNTNEIDIVAVNTRNKTLLLAEVKLDKRKGSLVKLQEKSKKLINQYSDYKPELKILSMNDLAEYLE